MLVTDNLYFLPIKGNIVSFAMRIVVLLSRVGARFVFLRQSITIGNCLNDVMSLNRADLGVDSY